MLIDSLCDLRENRARSLAWEQQAAALHTLLSFYECVEAIACSCCAQTTELCYVGRALSSSRSSRASRETLVSARESRKNSTYTRAWPLWYTVPVFRVA